VLPEELHDAQLPVWAVLASVDHIELTTNETLTPMACNAWKHKRHALHAAPATPPPACCGVLLPVSMDDLATECACGLAAMR
jgi:hypothetical protein